MTLGQYSPKVNTDIKDVHAHCYSASLVRTLYMTWRVPHHVFQARTPSRSSTKYRTDDLCGNLICEYFCWMLGEPHFFFQQIISFSDSFHYSKKQKKSVRGNFWARTSLTESSNILLLKQHINEAKGQYKRE